MTERLTRMGTGEYPGRPSVPFKVRRPEGLRNFPLVNFFIFTGEEHNPWRCELCVRKRERVAKGEASVTEAQALEHFGPDRGRPQYCRKCGMDFYR
jgi:hypothetical protein